MSYSSMTPNLLLPQFEEDDKPTWLGDVNAAMVKIDTAIGSRDATIATLTANLNATNATVASYKATINTLITRVNALDTTNPDIPLLP